MKKLILILLFTLAVTCAAAACDTQTPTEPSTDRLPATETAEPVTQAPETETETDSEATEEAVTETSAVTEEASETETIAVTLPETEAETTPAPDPHYIQFPLTDADDTTSYVSLPDMTAEGPRAVEFFVLPTDTDSPELTSALRLAFPSDGQTNIQVISFHDGQTYGFIFMLESTHTQNVEGTETRFVRMECASLGFISDKTMTVPATRYYHMSGGGSAQLNYTEQNRDRVLMQHRNPNRAALDRSENLIDKYSDTEKYEYTILYSYIDGVETVNTPVESIPEFPFSIFNEYGFDN